MPSELGIDFPKERTQPKRGWTAELNQESMPEELGIPAEIQKPVVKRVLDGESEEHV